MPATATTHGWVCGGRFAYPWADGMNDQGLFVAAADVPATGTTKSSRPPATLQTYVSGLLANCASVSAKVLAAGGGRTYRGDAGMHGQGGVRPSSGAAT